MSGSELDGLRVNHAALDKAAAEMYRTVGLIDRALDDMESDLQPLRADWSGHAQETYQQAKARWDWAIQEMRDLLDRSHQTVYQSNAEYAAADMRGAGLFPGG